MTQKSHVANLYGSWSHTWKNPCCVPFEKHLLEKFDFKLFLVYGESQEDSTPSKSHKMLLEYPGHTVHTCSLFKENKQNFVELFLKVDLICSRLQLCDFWSALWKRGKTFCCPGKGVKHISGDVFGDTMMHFTCFMAAGLQAKDPCLTRFHDVTRKAETNTVGSLVQYFYNITSANREAFECLRKSFLCLTILH